MSYYPVYRYAMNHGVPYTQEQVSVILSQPGVTCVDALCGKIMSGPPTADSRRPDGKSYHVGNYYNATKQLVFHGVSSKPRR